ncbi:putative ribonuclease H-like domain-containing protein, partial [Tanacetum coccineum]
MERVVIQPIWPAMVTSLEDDLKSTKAIYNKSLITLTKRVKKFKNKLKLKRRSTIVNSSEDEEASLNIEDPSKQGRMIEEIDQDVNVNLVKSSKQGEAHERVEHGMESDVDFSTASPQNDDDEITLAKTLVNIKRSAVKDKGKAIMHESEPPNKIKKRVQVQMSVDEELAKKKGEYDIWAMKMEHYLAHTDYPIWEVIQRGNGPVSVSTDTNGLIKVLPPKTAEEILARERERKARTTLLMALPEDHLAKFHKMTDAKEMWEAIKSRFGGNDESKKMQKYILKQQFEGFFVSNSEGLHKGYDRSLPSAWSQVSLIMRTKPGVDSLSFDDLYNNLRVFESDVKGSTASSSSTQNVAFVSENTSSTNDVSTAYGVSNSSGQNSQYEHTSSYSLLANQSSCPQLDHEDLEQLDEFDLEEMDLKWQVAMISMRMKKFYKKTGRKLQFDAKEPVGFDKTKVECYSCHKTGHFARECRSKGNQDSRRRDTWNTGNKDKENGRRSGKQEDSKALVTLDGEGVDWTSHSEDEQENYALMACSSSGSDTEVTSCSKECKESYAKLKKLYDEQREQLGDASIEIQAYTQALKKVEAQLVAHQQSQLWYEEKIRFMKIDLDDKTDVLTYHKKLLAEAEKEKEDLKAKVEKWHNSSKNLNILLNSQMSAKDKAGLGYGDQMNKSVLSYENEVFQSVFVSRTSDIEDSPVNDRYAEGMHAVPPPMIGIYIPSGPDKEIDDSQFTYGSKQSKPSESDARSSDFNYCESNYSEETHESMPEPVDYPQRTLQNKWIVDNGCFITGKGKIKTGNLYFEDLCFVKELQHFNLFSVSQMCDKKNKVLFTDSECLVLSPEFKLPDENQVLLRIPRQNNMYSFNLENIVPSGGLACLIAKATIDESNKWHRRLGHVNFKNLNKLVKGNLVRGLPSKIFQNDHTCVACQKGKQHKASCKAKSVSSISQPLQLLHMDLFGPTSVRSLNHKTYCLVITDDFSRFSWVFFLRTKDETSGILKDFIRQIENQLNQKVKSIRCDNGTEFKNRDFIEFCGSKGIKREYSNARTPQQNGVAERKNKTLIEAARTMLADKFYLTLFGLKQLVLQVDKEDQVFLDALERLKRQEHDANDAAGALRKEFAQETVDLLLQAGAAKPSSIKIVNTTSTPVSTASPYGGLSFTDLTNTDQDDYEIPALKDIYDNPTDGIFINASYDDEGAEAEFKNLETIVNVSPIPTSRINSIHPLTLILGDPNSVVQTRSKVTKSSGAHAF